MREKPKSYVAISQKKHGKPIESAMIYLKCWIRKICSQEYIIEHGNHSEYKIRLRFSHKTKNKKQSMTNKQILQVKADFLTAKERSTVTKKRKDQRKSPEKKTKKY